MLLFTAFNIFVVISLDFILWCTFNLFANIGCNNTKDIQVLRELLEYTLGTSEKNQYLCLNCGYKK